MAAVGGGYSWPRLCLWGDLDRIGLLSQADPVGVVGPVRYLTDAIVYIDAAHFEREVDDFLNRVADEQQGFTLDGQALRALIDALRQERSDPQTARWRRLEARLGFDPDQAPDAHIQTLNTLANHHGLESVEEAIAAVPSAQASHILERELQTTREKGHRCDFSHLLSRIPEIERKPTEPPWVAAEQAAQQTRAIAGMERGPMRNKRLADLLGTAVKSVRAEAGTDRLHYGLRISDQGPTGRQTTALRARWATARRFELCRALGDTLWARDTSLGPIADSSTARQKFQRAFAQSLLCPFSELLEYLKTDSPDSDDIAAAARHFHVGEAVVQTLLVNKGIIARSQLPDRLEAA
ncbi:hypothetical protein CKO42_25470 [Lamprobacter modestohalophilus]|uniref:Uncharacterized protein n=1 Tax=Lamprobacter modestohalophilus TaxID=1064514 RepID=A0A9X0WEQ3_9GAMM|nr:hypothetical protein [Lamprobacter modestohalophilus]MBK1621678.1 hypothetical protein [Lamprobacter modestohalophilus]